MRTAQSRVRAQVRVIGKAPPLYSGWRRPPAVSNLLYNHAMPLFGLVGGKRKVHNCTPANEVEGSRQNGDGFESLKNFGRTQNIHACKFTYISII